MRKVGFGVMLAVVALAGCSEPWMGSGQAIERAPAGTPMPEINMLPGLTGADYTRAVMEDGTTVVYRRAGGCTTPNTAYAMHHMAGKYECAILYTGAAHAGTGEVVFRDWLGRAYTPDSYGNWVRNSEYDLSRVGEKEVSDKMNKAAAAVSQTAENVAGSFQK